MIVTFEEKMQAHRDFEQFLQQEIAVAKKECQSNRMMELRNVLDNYTTINAYSTNEARAYDKLTEENANLQAENTRLGWYLNHMVEQDVINDCSIEREVISLLKGDEDE